jgi:type IV pilus assembly protein PilX
MKLPPMRTRPLQQGYILISTIIIVLLITLLALAGVSYNSTQTRIATNSKDGQIAFETAEAVLRQVADNIATGNASMAGVGCRPMGTAAVAGVINATCELMSNLDETPLWQTASPPWQFALPNGSATYKGSSSQSAGYIVEGLHPISAPASSLSSPGTASVRPYRVTVEAWGAISGSAPQVMLQTIVLGPV